MPPGIILVHGYSGSPGDIAVAAGHLEDRFGPGTVESVRLPGHPGSETVPRYDGNQFVQAIAECATNMIGRGRPIVLVGCSTGGILALDAILRNRLRPALLVLAATPHRLDGRALERWERHRAGRPAMPLGDVARMVSHINRIASAPPPGDLPVLIIQGENDPLVPPDDALAWQRHGFSGPVRSLMVPGAGHELLGGSGAPVVADWLARSIADFIYPCPAKEYESSEKLVQLEGPRLRAFFEYMPHARVHLARSPGAGNAMDEPIAALPPVAADPVQLNIEVTTHCNLACPHCARTVHPRPGKMMVPTTFNFLLDLVPNAYRIILAGLGEPTLHSQLPALITAAANRKRHVGLVTNGTNLTPKLSRSLIDAGLTAVTFSLDAADGAIAKTVRPGAAVDGIIANIREFANLAADADVATAIFTAVSGHTLQHLPQLAETVASLGVQAWMLTDLNFPWNRHHSVGAYQRQDATAAVRLALKKAFARNIPVLHVHGLEEFALAKRYRSFLLYPPDRLAGRNPIRTACHSPWQTLAVDVDGQVTCCDCQPRFIMGNLLTDPFSSIWNGQAMQTRRRRMVGDEPPDICRSCPRF